MDNPQRKACGSLFNKRFTETPTGEQNTKQGKEIFKIRLICLFD